MERHKTLKILNFRTKIKLDIPITKRQKKRIIALQKNIEKIEVKINRAWAFTEGKKKEVNGHMTESNLGSARSWKMKALEDKSNKLTIH